MSASGRLESTGFELQDALADAVGDPISDELASLEAEPLLRLIRDHPRNDARQFMADHHVPARSIDITAARRVLPVLRRDAHGKRMPAIRWLTSQLSPRVHDALVAAVGAEHGKRGHREVPLDEVIADYSAPAVRLAVFADWGTESGELKLAMLVVDGRALAERWRSHVDHLQPIAVGIVAELKEAREEVHESTDARASEEDVLDAAEADEPERDDSESDHSAFGDGDLVESAALSREGEASDAPQPLRHDASALGAQRSDVGLSFGSAGAHEDESSMGGEGQGVSASGAEAGDPGNVDVMVPDTSERAALARSFHERAGPELGKDAKVPIP